MFHWALNMSPIIVSGYRLYFLYYFFHFESIKLRSSRSQMSFKIEIFKNFAIFTGKHLCWSLFVIKLPAYIACTFIIKRLQHRYFFIIIAKFLRTSFFIEHLQQLLFKAMFETCQNFTMKNKNFIPSRNCYNKLMNNINYLCMFMLYSYQKQKYTMWV